MNSSEPTSAPPSPITSPSLPAQVSAADFCDSHAFFLCTLPPIFAFLNDRRRLACFWTLHKWNNLCVLDDVLSLTLGDSWRKLTVLCLFPAHGSVWTECNTACLPILQWWVFAWFLACCYYEQCFLNILAHLLVPSVSIPLGSSVWEPNCWVMSSVLPRWHQGSPKGTQAVQETPSAFCP